MSLKNILTVIFGLLTIGFVAYFSKDRLSQKNDRINTGFSSAELTRSVFSSKGTSQRIIPVSIKFNKVSQDVDRVTVVASFSLPFHFDGKLNYAWELGEGVQLSSGTLVGELDSLFKDKHYEVSIEVTNFSLQNNRTIGFEIQAAKDSHRIHGDALAASNIEDTFEHLVQNVERLKKNK